MKIAIPEFKGRVAPTFDFSRHLLLVDFTPKITSVDFSHVKGGARAHYIKDLDVDLLLCGSISRDMAREMEKTGIKVVPRLSGQIKEILEVHAIDMLWEENLGNQDLGEGKRNTLQEENLNENREGKHFFQTLKKSILRRLRKEPE